MAETYASVDIKGNVVRDPVLSTTPNGKTFTHVHIATNYRYESPAKSGNWKEETTYYTVELWGDNAERAVGKVHKGQYVGANGFQSMSQYTGRDNLQHYSLMVRNCTKIWDLERRPPRSAGPEGAPAPQAEAPAEMQAPLPDDTTSTSATDLDELPF